MEVSIQEVRHRGKGTGVPAVNIDGTDIVVVGRWPRIARIRDEDWQARSSPVDAERLASALRHGLVRADILELSGRYQKAEAAYGAAVEIDNDAIINTADADGWWTGLPQEARKNVRRSQRKGVSVKLMEFDDKLVQDIKRIYDETPIRSGKKFWHYGKPLDDVRRENSSYLNRSVFVGAFHEGQMIGFLKFVRVGSDARIMQILALESHRDRRPLFPILKLAVDVCQGEGVERLIYGKYEYRQGGGDGLTEFKSRLGFRREDRHRVHLPLTWAGRALLMAGFRSEWRRMLPGFLLASLVSLRRKVLSLRHSSPLL